MRIDAMNHRGKKMQRRRVVFMLGGLLGASSMSGAGAMAAGSGERGSVWHMPSVKDNIRMAWVQGPPVLQVFRPIDEHLRGFRESDALLGFRGGEWGMLFDPRGIKVERLTRSAANEPGGELLDLSAIRRAWDAATLEMRAVSGGKTYRPSGGPLRKDDPDYSPIHIVESGDWFQHIAVYDLELRDESGAKLEAKSWLEIRAWGDRCLFEWFVEPATDAQAQLSIALGAGDVSQSAQAAARRVQLGVAFSGGGMTAVRDGNSGVKLTAESLNDYTLGDPGIRYSEVSDAWEISIPKQRWPGEDGAAYNKDLLERVSRFALGLENTSEETRDVRLRFIHDHHPLTGYVPMMLDARGRQTGLPIQNSKNWHSLPDERYPYDSTWIRTTTRVRLDPGAKVEWEYIVPHALWQGVPLSSAAQLSLIGWGFNGFWVQMALGSWGETLCVQPGRTLRRAFIADMRPFMTLGMDSGKPYHWPANVGGGDIAKITGPDGKLVMWQAAVTDFRAIGPNLSHVRVTERLQDNAMRMVVDTYLPRSSSIARSYFKVWLDVLEDTEIGELALFQLGSDYYNEIGVRSLAWGDASGLAGSAEPPAKKWGRVAEPVLFGGKDPWVSLQGMPDDADRKSAAVRGAIMRDYRAVIGGEPDNEVRLVPSRVDDRLSADLVLPARVTRLNKGDRIEFLIEIVVVPAFADLYYGEDTALGKRLAASPDSWQEVAHEAAKQTLEIDGRSAAFPATVEAGGEPRQSFTVRAASRMDTVRLTGLDDPSSWQIGDVADDEWRPLGQRFPEEADPQLNYEPATGTWTAVLSLVFPEGGRERVLEVRALPPHRDS